VVYRASSQVEETAMDSNGPVNAEMRVTKGTLTRMATLRKKPRRIQLPEMIVENI